jgi:hypothetical protein
VSIYYFLRKGTHGELVLGAFLATALVSVLVMAGLYWPKLGPVSVALALAAGLAFLSTVIGLLGRLRGELSEARNNVTLESSLARLGWRPLDLFSGGAAATPTLQLLNLKVLRLVQPTAVLELGSGESTKLLSAYAEATPAASVMTLEQDKAWFERLRPHIRHDYRFAQLESKEFSCAGTGLRIKTVWYEQPSDLSERKFNYILVDGPNLSRGGNTSYSRSGILQFLPSILAESFVLIFDDAERRGERMSVRAVDRVLRSCGVRFVRFSTHGAKTQVVFCSPDLHYLGSI